MIHRQISVKLHEDLYLRLEKTAKVMHMNKHAIVVTAVEDTLNMIDNRGCEKVPLLVMQARTAQDYAQAAPPLPIRSDAGTPETPRETQEPEQRKNTADIRSKRVSPRAP